MLKTGCFLMSPNAAMVWTGPQLIGALWIFPRLEAGTELGFGAPPNSRFYDFTDTDHFWGAEGSRIGIHLGTEAASGKMRWIGGR